MSPSTNSVQRLCSFTRPRARENGAGLLQISMIFIFFLLRPREQKQGRDRFNEPFLLERAGGRRCRRNRRGTNTGRRVAAGKITEKTNSV